MALPVFSDIVVLRSGQSIKGDILFNNDEVVVLRKKDGTRYQYPKTEVLSITEETQPLASMDTLKINHKKVAVQLLVFGGTAYIPYTGWGGTTEVHAMVGAHKLFDTEVSLGGSVGYRGVFTNGARYSWIPLQLLVEIPITANPSSRHKPLLGGSLGYAISTNQKWGGGLCAGVDVGWCYQINSHSHLSLSVATEWQQTDITIVETINGSSYSNRIGCSIVSIGVKLGIYF